MMKLMGMKMKVIRRMRRDEMKGDKIKGSK
jgi:hypothetical protein